MGSALDQFKNMPKEPQLWEQREKEQDNEIYQKETIDISTAKKNLMRDLYWVWWKEFAEQINSWEELIEFNNLQKIEEHPQTPLVDTLVEQWLLTINEWDLIKQSFINNENNENNDLEKNILSVEWIDVNKKQKIIETINFLSKETTKEQCIKDFYNDFNQEIYNFKEDVRWWKKWEKELVWRNKDLIEHIWANYFIFNWEKWKENPKDSLDRAIKTTLNELMDNKLFNRPDTFDKMLNIVRNKELSFDERFNELKKIDSLINTDQSRANWRQANDFRNVKNKEHLTNSLLAEKFDQLRLQLQLSINNSEKKEIWEQLLELKQEAENSWEVFISWEIDKLIENNDINLRET